MVCGRFNASAPQAGVDFLYILTSAGIHDSEGRPLRKLDDSANFFGGCCYLPHLQIEVRPIESAHDLRRTVDAQLPEDVAANGRSSGSGQSQNSWRFQFTNYIPQPQVIGTKIMAPKGYTVCLVNSQQADFDAGQAGAEFVILEAFGCNVEDLDFAGNYLFQPASLLFARNCAIDE